MNIWTFEFKQLRISVFIWALSLSAVLFLFMSFFPAFGNQNDALLDVLDQYPEELLSFFGMNTDLPFTGLMGYFSLTFGFIMVPMAIQAANYGFHILSVEERELTADFLLTKPVTRKRVYLAKIGASILSLLITNLILYIMSFTALYLFRGEETVAYMDTVVFLLSLILFQLFFFSLALLISVSIKKVTSVIGFSMSLGFGFYIISSLGMMISSDILQLLSPFAHFDPTYPFVNGHIQYGRIWISLIVVVLSFILSYKLYLNRNITSL